ncbi:MAG TPA: hypothetical protein VE621_01735, partial [Bryobacteraceae bacterium]|nr:hypothetical protein [Bryobacteraceae bacterium]
MPSARKVAWVLLVAALAVAVLFVVYPVYVIWPFRPQRVDELALALTVKASSLVGTVVCAVVATVSAVVIWSGSRRWTSKALVLATAIATT